MKNNRNNSKENSVNNNYNLKSDAVDDLVNADSEETPEYSQEELNRYRSRKEFNIPDTIKILLIKVWFAGAVCFFFYWGLGTYIGSLLDMLFVLGVALGIVTDLLLNNVIRFIEKTPGENDWWMMYPKKGMGSFFMNMIHAFVVIICVYLLYNGINLVLTSISGNPDSVPLGVEPILFGVFTMGFDMLFICIKHGLKNLFSRVSNSMKKHGK